MLIILHSLPSRHKRMVGWGKGALQFAILKKLKSSFSPHNGHEPNKKETDINRFPVNSFQRFVTSSQKRDPVFFLFPNI